MDVCEMPQALEKQSTLDATTPPLILAVNNHGTYRSRIREVSSRYKSPARSTGPKRCSSPNTGRASPTSTVSGPQKAVSAERKRSVGLLSPPSPSPSTPVKDTSSEMLLASKKIVTNKLPEYLRPSAVRNLSVSFKSDILSVPISKREKPVSIIPADRAPRPSSNIAHKQAEELPASRKPTPERKSTPNIGKWSSDKSENSKPIDSLPACLVDQHRWPTRVKGKESSTALDRNTNLTHKISKTASLYNSIMAESHPRRLSLDGTSKPLQIFTTDLLMLRNCCDSGKVTLNECSSDSSSASSSSPDKTLRVYAAARARSLPTSGFRPPSPPVSRGTSPARNKVGKPSSRGSSPARARPSSPSRQPQRSTSVLSFIADIKKGNKAANHIEDVHQLRLLYNRHLQWRYANARSDSVLHSLKVKAEKIFYSMWRTIAYMLDSATAKRTHLQQLRLILKLYSILDNQLTCLDQWALVERDHANSLTLIARDLQAGTIRIPVTGGARVDIETIKAAVCSVVDVMQTMGSSLCSILSQMEGMNSLISQVADIAAQERAMLDECESLMSITAAFQVEEYSLRSQLLQSSRALGNGDCEPAIFGF